MNLIIGSIALWLGVIWVARHVRLYRPELRAEIIAASWAQLLFVAPRIAVGVMGAAFVAELLPEEGMRALFGTDAGLTAYLLALALGPLTPGGAIAVFAIASAALQAGAAPAPLISYLTAWALFGLNKILVYELPFAGRALLWQRIALSWPWPLAIAAVAALLL